MTGRSAHHRAEYPQWEDQRYLRSGQVNIRHGTPFNWLRAKHWIYDLQSICGGRAEGMDVATIKIWKVHFWDLRLLNSLEKGQCSILLEKSSADTTLNSTANFELWIAESLKKIYENVSKRTVQNPTIQEQFHVSLKEKSQVFFDRKNEAGRICKLQLRTAQERIGYRASACPDVVCVAKFLKSQCNSWHLSWALCAVFISFPAK